MKKVTMFTSNTWPYCTMAKEFLSKNNIHFVEKNISVDVDARNELSRRNISGVPAFFIGDDVVVGLDKAKILELVDHRLIECEECHAKLRAPINKGMLKITCPKCKNEFNWQPR